MHVHGAACVAHIILHGCSVWSCNRCRGSDAGACMAAHMAAQVDHVTGAGAQMQGA